jgi:hypothetical protein
MLPDGLVFQSSSMGKFCLKRAENKLPSMEEKAVEEDQISTVPIGD